MRRSVLSLIVPLIALLSLTSEARMQTQLPPEGHIASLSGIQMYYEVYGQGSPLVLLHGFGGSSLDWKPFIPDVAKEYRVIVPDLRGHGQSTNPTNQFTHRQSALDVFALLDQLDITRYGDHVPIDEHPEEFTRTALTFLRGAWEKKP